jgi:hypothetical protein
MEGMESCEYFLQMNQANAIQSTLHATESDTDTNPSGREKNNAAGLIMKAAIRKVAVVVYPVPVDF